MAYVGDMVREDIEGSQAVGMTPIMIERQRPGDQPLDYDYRASSAPAGRATQTPDGVHVVSSLADLTRLFP